MEQQELFERDTTAWVYESPDGGKTIYRLYFLLFYYFGVILAWNILVAFAIDIYAVVERLDN